MFASAPSIITSSEIPSMCLSAAETKCGVVLYTSIANALEPRCRVKVDIGDSILDYER